MESVVMVVNFMLLAVRLTRFDRVVSRDCESGYDRRKESRSNEAVLKGLLFLQLSSFDMLVHQYHNKSIQNKQKGG
jgi:hypothetical protein